MRGIQGNHCHLQLMVTSTVANIDHRNTSNRKMNAHGCVRGSVDQRMINNTAIFHTRRQDSLDYCDDVHGYRGVSIS